MTKKHYEMVARVIENEVVGWKKQGKYGNGTNELIAIHELCNSLADAFEADNPRFDEQRFLSACGVTA